MNLENITVTVDTLLSKYGQPVTEGWHKYAQAKTFGWEMGILFGFLLWLFSIIVGIKTLHTLRGFQRNKENIGNHGWYCFLAFICASYFIGWAIYFGASIINLSVAIYFPDAYWLIDAVKPATF